MSFKGIIKFFSIRALEGLIIILLITFIPNIPPDASFSTSQSVTPSLELEGKLAVNDRLNEVEIWHKGDFVGPEAFAEFNGELYTTIHGGDIVKLTNDHITPIAKFGKPCKGIYQEQICGRPLGLTFDKDGALYVADAYYGIFKVDIKTGKKLQLVSTDHEIAGKKPKLPNSVAVASNGDIYWSDSSTEFHLNDLVFDMLADGSGRLIRYDVKTKKNTVLIDKLHFANGVKLSSDESFVIVSECGKSRIHRYYIKGPKKDTNDIFLDGLPGLPDNIQDDGQNGFLVSLFFARDSTHPSIPQIFSPFPLVRKFFARVLGLIELGFKLVDQIYPNEWCERGVHLVGHLSSIDFLIKPPRQTILQISEKGVIIDSLHSTNKRISGISEAFIFKDKLYLGSPANDFIARLPLSKAGLKPKLTTAQPPKVTTPPPTTTPEITTPKPTVTPKVTTPPPTPAPKATKPSTTAAPKATSPPTAAPKITTPLPTAAPKVTTPSPPAAPKVTTPPPKAAPKVTTTPPTAAPKVTTTPPTAAPKVTTTPPTAVPKVTTPPPTVAPKVTTTPPTTVPKVTTPPPTVVPKVITSPPTAVPKVTTPPTAAPKATTPPPTAAPKAATSPPTTTIPKTTATPTKVPEDRTLPHPEMSKTATSKDTASKTSQSADNSKIKTESSKENEQSSKESHKKIPDSVPGGAKKK